MRQQLFSASGIVLEQVQQYCEKNTDYHQRKFIPDKSRAEVPRLQKMGANDRIDGNHRPPVHQGKNNGNKKYVHTIGQPVPGHMPEYKPAEKHGQNK